MALINNRSKSGATPSPAANSGNGDTQSAGGGEKRNKAKPPKIKRPSRVRWGRVMIGGTIATIAGGTVIGLALSSAPQTVQIAFTTTPLAANESVDVNSLEWRAVPVDGLPAQPLTTNDLSDAGWYAEKDLPAGTPLTVLGFDNISRIDVGSLDDPSLMAQSFEAVAEDAVGGILKPGDYVNILATENVLTGEPTVRYVLSKVVLLDVAAQAADRSSGLSGAQAGADARYSGIPSLYTVALTPTQTAILTAAKDSNLTVVLTRPDAEDLTGAVYSNGRLTINDEQREVSREATDITGPSEAPTLAIDEQFPGDEPLVASDATASAPDTASPQEAEAPGPSPSEPSTAIDRLN